MKYIPILALLTLAMGCRKNNDDRDRYQGIWELHSSLSIAGPVSYPRGNGQLIVFAGQKVKIISQGIVLSEEPYTLQRETYPYLQPPRQMDKVITTTREFYVERSADTLSYYLGFPITDGGAATYVRRW